MYAEVCKFSWDAQWAAERAARFTHGKIFSEYEADELLRSGVERQLAIVGEALNHLRRIDATTAASIPGLPRVSGFRNVLVHGYANVDDKIVWGIIEANLGPLLKSLEAVLAQS